MRAQDESHGRARGRIGSRRRRAKLTVIVSTLAASALAISVGQTGAYFTGATTAGSGTGTTSTTVALPAPGALSVTKTGATTGQSSALTWSAPSTRPWEATAGTSGAIEYTVSRNTVDAFGPASGAVQVYKGGATSVTDSSGSAPVSLASQVVGWQKMDASSALINGVPYRWGTAFRINADRSEARSNLFQGASGQDAFNTGVATEMQFANSSEKEELVSLAPGRDHICALSVTKKVFCMGFGHLLGQTGTATDQNATTALSLVQWNRLQDPRGVFTGKSIIQITSGEMFSCALASDGTIGCWGINDFKQLGNGGYTAASIGAPIKVAQTNGNDWPAFAVNKPVMIAAGGTHVCALKGLGANGEVPTAPVACWGAADQSQLGTYSAAASTAEPQDVADPNGVLTGVRTITAGSDATCVLNDKTATTNVACWGWGGLIGRSSGSSAPANSGVPTAINSSVTGFSSLDMNWSHACGASGTSVVCWGANSFGKLGTGSESTNFFLPTAVVDTDNAFRGEKITSVGAGWSHTCASTEKGSVACWGYGSLYQLGQGSSATDGNGNDRAFKPVTILFGGTKLKPLGADLLADGEGGHYTIARINGSYYNWGANGSSDSNKPAVVTGYPANITKLAAGYDHACGITGSDSKVYCSGKNASGQLGNNSTTNSVGVAVQISDPEGVFTGKTVIDVTASSQGSCALTSDGVIGCWGDGANGQLTERSTSNSSTPLRIGTGTNGLTPYPALSGSAKPLAISSGHGFFCARTAVSVACWGANGNLQLGRTTSASYDPVPGPVGGSTLSRDVASVDSGYYSSCAVKVDSTAYCWGKGGFGALAQGTSDSATPLQVPGTGYAKVSVGWSVCAVMVQIGPPKCWGRDSSGQMGRGVNTSDSNTYIATVGSTSDTDGEFGRSGVVSIYSGDEMHCAMTGSGNLYCWGWSTLAQTAQDGNTTHVLAPKLVQIATGVTVVGAAKSCLDGAALGSANGRTICSLVPSRPYFYQVTYSVTSVPNWVSPRQSASR